MLAETTHKYAIEDGDREVTSAKDGRKAASAAEPNRDRLIIQQTSGSMVASVRTGQLAPFWLHRQPVDAASRPVQQFSVGQLVEDQLV